MFVLQLSLHLMPSLVHRVQFVHQVIVISACLAQLFFHFVIVNLQSAQF